MSHEGESNLPEEPQSYGEEPEKSREPFSESVEIRLEIEQRLPGGFIRFSWHSFRRNRRTKRATRAKPGLRVVIPLVIFFTVIIIGLIAVGPEGVWKEIKELLPNLFEPDA